MQVSNALRFVNSHGGALAFVTPDGFCVRSEMVDTCKDALPLPDYARLNLRAAAHWLETCEVLNMDDGDRVSEDVEVFPVIDGHVDGSALRLFMGY